MWGKYPSNHLQIIYWKCCSGSWTLPSSVTNPLCRYVLFNCQLGITMTRYMTNFSNYNCTISPTLPLIFFLSISFYSVAVSLARTTFFGSNCNTLRVENRVFKCTTQNGLSKAHFHMSQNQPSLPKPYVRLLGNLVSLKNIQPLIIISTMRKIQRKNKNNHCCHTMLRTNRDTKLSMFSVWVVYTKRSFREQCWYRHVPKY